MAGQNPSHILSVEGLTKDFPAVRALDDVSLSFATGTVHGIVGENGAGKSTLMKIISGIYAPTAGRVVFRDDPVQSFEPLHAMRSGIAMVHQELNLIGDLSVAENIFLGREDAYPGGVIRRRRSRERAADVLERVGADIDASAMVRDLPIARQQMVEIAKALSYDARVLIMDEPTAVLTGREVRLLFELIARLKREGVAVLYISHILPEVLEICDVITVMRDGRVVDTLAREDVGRGEQAERKLGSMMVGRDLGDHFPEPTAASEEMVLQVRDLSAAPQVKDVSFAVRRGEILGFAGLVGAGRTELAEAIAGHRTRKGTVTVDGSEVRSDAPQAAVRAGIAYLSEDRRGKGLVVDRPIVENITQVSLNRYCRVLIRSGRERSAARRRARSLSIRYGRLRDRLTTLSGGNQQKVALAKWLEVSPKVLLLDEPTRGVDIGAKEEIYRQIASLAAGGMACVFISSELNELLGMCHRIAVMRSGRLAKVLCGDEISEENVMLHAAGVLRAEVP